MAKIFIDGAEMELADADNLLKALLERGVDLPYFCWHPAMGSVGACRQCAIVQYRDEDDTEGRIVMACMTPPSDGGRFSIATDKAAAFRKSVIENLMVSHPHDCPVCEEGGECHLQDMTMMAGHRDRQYHSQKVTFRNQYLGPLIGHEMNRCITCYRCVRFYQDYAGGDDLGAFASRDRVYFGRVEDGVLENEFAGNLVEVCPTGVFTDKPLAQRYTRKWDLQSAPSICVGCSLGCNTSVAERYGELRRIHNRYHGEVNGYFLCDRGRFGGGFVNSPERIPHVGRRLEGDLFEAISEQEGIAQVAELMQAGRVVGIGSPRASLESNFALQQLVGRDNFLTGVTRRTAEINDLILETLRTTPARVPSMIQTETFDAVLILGEDVTNHAPRLALSLRQATRNQWKHLAKDANIPLWHDAAVRKIGQDDRSPLIVVTPYPDRLDDAAFIRIRRTPEEIARFGHAVALTLTSSASDEIAEVQSIGEMLRRAEKPLVVAGGSLGNKNIIKAAANIAAALARDNPEAGIVLCPDECNSVGAALLPHSDLALDDLLEGEHITTAIVLENDLATRLPHGQFEQLLDRIDHLIVLDHLDNATASRSELVFPTATFAESEGTWVNNEGRAQRAFAAFIPKPPIDAAWHWLVRIGNACGADAFADLHHIDDVIARAESTCANLEGIRQAAPAADFRIAGARIPRMPHRYSGRTAMAANISVHEPKQPTDTESALAFTMEGATIGWPAALRPFAWSPGWNSNHAINKFQEEIAGALRGGDPGARLLHASASEWSDFELEFEGTNELELVPRHHIFGSEELSIRAPAIEQLAPRAWCTLHPSVARTLGVQAGDGLECATGGEPVVLEVIVDDNVAEECVIYSAGLPATRPLSNLTATTFAKAHDWEPPAGDDKLITSDRRR